MRVLEHHVIIFHELHEVPGPSCKAALDTRRVRVSGSHRRDIPAFHLAITASDRLYWIVMVKGRKRRVTFDSKDAPPQ